MASTQNKPTMQPFRKTATKKPLQSVQRLVVFVEIVTKIVAFSTYGVGVLRCGVDYKTVAPTVRTLSTNTLSLP